MPESPLEDYQVDRPDVYVEQSIQLTGTNGRMLGHIYPTLLDPCGARATHKMLEPLPATTMLPAGLTVGPRAALSGDHI